MHNLLVQLAGIVALATSIAHGVIGETKVFARARIEPERLRLLMRLVWQAGTVAWMSLAILLIAAPKLGAEARIWIIAMSIVTFGVRRRRQRLGDAGTPYRLGCHDGRRRPGRNRAIALVHHRMRRRLPRGARRHGFRRADERQQREGCERD